MCVCGGVGGVEKCACDEGENDATEQGTSRGVNVRDRVTLRRSGLDLERNRFVADTMQQQLGSHLGIQGDWAVSSAVAQAP